MIGPPACETLSNTAKHQSIPSLSCNILVYVYIHPAMLLHILMCDCVCGRLKFDEDIMLYVAIGYAASINQAQCETLLPIFVFGN